MPATHQLTCDTCIVGAGCPGSGAAIAASRLCSRVILVERDPLLGGATTNAGVCVWQPTLCHEPVCREFYEAAA